MLCSGKSEYGSLAGAQYALGMREEQGTRMTDRDWRGGQEETRQKTGCRWVGMWAWKKLQPRMEGELEWSQNSGWPAPDFLFSGYETSGFTSLPSGMGGIGQDDCQDPL